MQSSQGPRSQRLTYESLRTRRLWAAAPFGQGAGTPRARGGQKREEKVRAACGPWWQAYPPSTGPQPLHECAPGPGHGSRIQCVAWGSRSKAPPCVPKRVLLALDVSLDQVCVRDSLTP